MTRRLATGALLLAGLGIAWLGLSQPLAGQDLSETGKRLFETNQCTLCHPGGGQGIGPALAGVSQERFLQAVRNGSGSMPPFSSSRLSDADLDAIYTFLLTLGGGSSPTPEAGPTPPAPTPGPGTEAIAPTSTPAPETKSPPSLPPGASPSLTLSLPSSGTTDKPFLLQAELRQGDKPLASVPVRFLARADFFASGLMEIGEADTDAQGLAQLEFVPTWGGKLEIVAEASGVSGQSTGAITVIDKNLQRYRPRAGIRLPPLGPELVIGSALPVTGAAPFPVLRLAGNSWLLLLAGLLATLWTVFLTVMYQVLRISRIPSGEAWEPAHRSRGKIIVMAMFVLLFMALLLQFVVLTGPNSNPHLFP